MYTKEISFTCAISKILAYEVTKRHLALLPPLWKSHLYVPTAYRPSHC